MAWNFKPRLRPRSQVIQRTPPVTLDARVTQPSHGQVQLTAVSQVQVQQSNVSGQAQQTAVSNQEGEGDIHASIISDKEGVITHQENVITHQEGATTHKTGDSTETVREQMHDENAVYINTPPTSTAATTPTKTTERDELLQAKIEQVRELMGAKTSKPLDHNMDTTNKTEAVNPMSRPRREKAGNWKDGPARFKALSLQALCSTTSRQDWFSANKMSLKQALKQERRREAVQKSIDAEIDTLEQPGVLKAVRYQDIPKEARKDIISAYMFHKEKFKADGSLNPISVMTQINLACTKKSLIAAYDIKGAFFLTPVEEGVELYLRVGPELTEFWCARHPERISYLHSDGCLYFKLERYVYGLHEAPNKFNGFLDSHLKKLGFQPSKADKCFYTRDTKEGKIMLSDHVDDMLVTFPTKQWRDWFEKKMKPFELGKQYDNVSYLGIQIAREKNGDTTLSQKGYIENMLKRHGLTELRKYPNRPATEAFTQKIDGEYEQVNTKEYLSLVMGLMYASRFTRIDIAFAVGYLATKCSKPTEQDLMNAKRVLKYLGKTIDEKMRFKAKVAFKPQIYADASHHLYDIGHGQAGMVITNGSAPVGHRSAKLKLITRSSSESELCSLEDASTYAIWYKNLLQDMGIETGAVEILQDNKSTIIMATQGLNFRHNKHIMARKMFIQERIESGEVTLKYCKTKDMVADILTKVIDIQAMKKLKQELCIEP